MRREELERARRWAHGSYLALGVLPHSSRADLEILESAISHWSSQLEIAKWPRSIGWFTNAAFLAGNHYPNFRWNEMQTSLDWDDPKHNQVPADEFIPKTADNRMIRPVEHNVSLLNRVRPEPRIEPNSDHPFDIDAARLGETLLANVLWERLGLPEQHEGVAYDLCTFGNSMIETTFEETDIPIMRPSVTKRRRKNELTGETETVEEPGEAEFFEWKRDVQCRRWAGPNFDPDPGATDDPKSHTWFMRQSFVDIDWVRDEFDRDEEFYLPQNVERVHEDSSNASPLYWYERLKDLLDTPNGWYGLTSWPYSTGYGYAPNQCVMRVIDVKPTRYFPQGRTLIQCGGALLYSGPARAWHEDYTWRWHPYSHYRFWRIPGRFWGMPLLSELVPLQRRINAIDALIQLNREYIALGQWLIPTTAKIPDGATSGLPGMEMRYRPSPSGAKPEKIKNEPLPAELIGERSMCEKQINEISGIDAPLESRAPSGVRALGMLEFLENKMNKQRAPLLHGFERGLESTSQNILIEAAINYDEPNTELTQAIRVAVMAGNHDLSSLDNFLGSDLRDNVHVRIDIVSAIMRAPETRKELALQFNQYNPNMSQQERAIVARILDLDEFDREVSPQFERATSMVAMVTSGVVQAAIPMKFDDPEIFLQVIRTEILKKRYKDYPPEVQATLNALANHYQQVAAKNDAEAFQQMLQRRFLLAQAEKGVSPDALDEEEGGEEAAVLSLVQGGGGGGGGAAQPRG